MMMFFLIPVIFFLLISTNLTTALPLQTVDEDDVFMPDLTYLGTSVFKKPNAETGILVAAWNKTSGINPEELGEYAEGDIRFPNVGRNGIIAETRRWSGGVIPYKIEGYFDSDSLKIIQRAIDLYHKYTCIKFRERTLTDEDYISIINTNTGCWSSVGRIGGRQEVNLQSPGCTYTVGTPAHELMHAAGFLHEQSRFERDDFVIIVWSNIMKGYENNFDKADSAKTTAFGVPYDFGSVMHYSSTAFSINGESTIIAKIPIIFFALTSTDLTTALPLQTSDDVAMPDLTYLGASVFKEPNAETGTLVEAWNETSETNPEELGEYAEGDIRFPKTGRNGMIAETLRWPDGVIPYKIEGYFDSDSLKNIQRAIDIYHKYTCIKFRERTFSDEDYISIVNANTGCWSSVGRIGGRQEVNLQNPGCTSRVGTPIHELMHAAGFLHEQNRFERDDFVTIAWSNIKRGHENNFDKADSAKTTGFGVPYDFRSVMHYSSTAFSVNGNPTIVPKDSAKTEKMGQREGFSRGDITKLNKMYNCPEKTTSVTGNASGNSNGSNNSNNSENNKAENKENSNPLINIAQGIINSLFQK